jgi:hypothetical protein
MSEEPEQVPEKVARITKTKSPGRVAAGKKLAEMNKKNKAKKAQQLDEESTVFEGINVGHLIGAIGLCAAGVSLYWQWRDRKQPQPIVPSAPTKVPQRVPDMD